MIASLTEIELKKYVSAQIRNLIPDFKFKEGMIKDEDVQLAFFKCQNCFKHIKNNAYSNDDGEVFFSHLHADQYATFLIYLANLIWIERQDKIVCDRLMYLNRILHSFMMSYKAKIPDIFWLGHPVGSVIGNADYSDYLYITQNCTINTGPKADDGTFTPKIGKYFSMGAGAIVIGDKTIGDNCSIGAGAMIYNQQLEDNSIVINNCGRMEIKKNRPISLAAKLFR